MTTVTPNLDSLLATAPDDRGEALLEYSRAILAADTIDDLATTAFAKTARTLSKSVSVVRSDFTRVQGYKKAQAAFDPAELERARAKETATRKADALFTHGGRAAKEFLGHADSQPTGPLRIFELTARLRQSEPEQRESLLEEIQGVQAEAERLAHRAKVAANTVEELLRKRDKVRMISEGDLFLALNNEPTGENR